MISDRDRLLAHLLGARKAVARAQCDFALARTIRQDYEARRKLFNEAAELADAVTELAIHDATEGNA